MKKRDEICFYCKKEFSSVGGNVCDACLDKRHEAQKERLFREEGRVLVFRYKYGRSEDEVKAYWDAVHKMERKKPPVTLSQKNAARRSRVLGEEERENLWKQHLEGTTNEWRLITNNFGPLSNEERKRVAALAMDSFDRVTDFRVRHGRVLNAFLRGYLGGTNDRRDQP